MKKKVLFTLWTCAFLVMLYSNNISAQNSVLLPEKQQHVYDGNDHHEQVNPFDTISQSAVVPRRQTNPNRRDSIHGAIDADSVFGAGESVAVGTQLVVWPSSNGTPTLNRINIGSEYAKNAVIGIYDEKGLAAGALDTVRLYDDGTGDDDDHTITGQPPQVRWRDDSYVRLKVAEVTYNSAKDAGAYHPIEAGGTGNTNPYYLDGNGGLGSVFYPYKAKGDSGYIVIVWNHVTFWPTPQNILAFRFFGATADTLYTTTRNLTGKTDDGKSLLYVHPGKYRNDGNLSAYHSILNSAEYIRPTTVLLSGNNDLDSIAIGDIEWYAAYLYGKADTKFIEPFWAFNAKGCSHYSGWVSYYRDDITFDTISTAAGHGDSAGVYGSGRLVDGAVRLLDEADVYVRGNVSDNTSTPYSKGTPARNATDALLVLPGRPDFRGERSNFRLKIGGNANILHTQDSSYYNVAGPGANPLTDGYLYSDHVSGIDGPKFPVQQSAVYLPGSIAGNAPLVFEEITGLTDYEHPRGKTLTDFTSPDATLWMPYAKTKASVYGVHGLYNGATEIHTRTSNGNDTTSIIETGSITNHQDKFHVYSSGVLKNFRPNAAPFCDSLVIGDIDGYAPYFHLSNDLMPLYVLNDGAGDGLYCCESGIRFNGPGVDSISNAIKNAEGGGDLHIQAKNFVRFYDKDVNFAQKKDNEVKILSDTGVIYVENNFLFTNADTAHLTLWAKGKPDPVDSRSCVQLYCDDGKTGGVRIDGATTINYSGGIGSGLLLMRSEYDDVLLNAVTYNNTAETDLSGESMIQAGQDIFAGGAVQFDTKGRKSLLFEAKNTIHFGNSAAVNHSGTVGNVTFKAGYREFSTSSVPAAANYVPLSSTYAQSLKGNNYVNRKACTSTLGADIWHEGPVRFDYSAATLPDTIETMLRAFNSIYLDHDFTYINGGSGDNGNGGNSGTSPVTLFAETGNIEAIRGAGTTLSFELGAADSSRLTLQAGNQLGNPCAVPTQLNDNGWDKGSSNGAEYDGNILLNKRLNVASAGTGNVLLSATRDIETQTGGYLNFLFSEGGLNPGDLLLTAGRHVETHASTTVDYANRNDSASVMIQAGRLNAALDNCNILLCKASEAGSNLASGSTPYDVAFSLSNNPDNDNLFSQGGSGNGSILLFDSLDIRYRGVGEILLTALNGDIVSDPYLHKNDGNTQNSGTRGYNAPANEHNAPIVINHNEGQGITRLEAIDIRLHDKIDYLAAVSADGQRNGQFLIAAFDSVLTRNLKYTNPLDTGSVFITAAKYKYTGSTDCGEYNCNMDAGGINQGHIVLGYGADYDKNNTSDSIIFDYNSGGTNSRTSGANIHILAGFEGFEKNPVNGRQANAKLFADDRYGLDRGRGKGYGGNITFDYTEFYMPTGNGRQGGFTEIRTPNGNIWGKDSILYRGINGDFLVDAGLGSSDDPRAILWSGFSCNTNNILNTQVPFNCNDTLLWRTGNIMLKGAHLNFGSPSASGVAGTGDAIFRTREGYIDLYDAFTADSMSGDLLVYAGMDNLQEGRRNSFGDASARDFAFTAIREGGSVFFGADDNIMLNYGNSNTYYKTYGNGGKGFPGHYDETAINKVAENPYYYTPYEGYIDGLHAATYNVNEDGYLFYKNGAYLSNPGRQYHNNMHQMYRGGTGAANPCTLKENGARELLVNFDRDAQGNAVQSGGFAAVANNYIDLFTKFTYLGGTGTAMGAVPGMSGLHGESVTGYGLYIKSQYNADGYNTPESRRATCEGCREKTAFPIQGSTSDWIPEMTYIGFHDESRIHTHHQKSLLEAPVIEFFGHAELDAYSQKGSQTKITLRSDSLIFHDSVIFDGHFRTDIDFLPYTTSATQRLNDMRYGVINDRGPSLENYKNISKDVQGREKMGAAISMPDRNLPVIELGYQRCTEPGETAFDAPNARSLAGLEPTPRVGGDVIVAFKHDFRLPIFNTVVANNARISFLGDSYDGVRGGEYFNAFIRTDLLRIRNRVEFYSDPSSPSSRSGKFVLTTYAQMDDVMDDPGIYMYHLHTEPGSELSIPGEDSITVIPTTTIGGYGNIHENIFVKDGGILAPGFASLMESDCQTPYRQGRLTVHDLTMEQYSILRVSVSSRNCTLNGAGELVDCTQTDTVTVQDKLIFMGKISVAVMPETETLDPGCYLFMEYGDAEGVSAEYAKNLTLLEERYRDNYFSLDFTEPGKVYLCVTPYQMPVIQRYVDLPAVEGVTYNYVIVNGERAIHKIGRNYVKGHQDFSMNLTWTGAPLKVWAHGFYSHSDVDLDPTSVGESDGSVTYTIRRIVEPWTISFGPQSSTGPWVGNETLLEQHVWAHRNTLYINALTEDVVSIYNMTGVLNRKVEIPAGLSKMTLDRGVYVVTLKDGKVYKIVIN